MKSKRLELSNNWIVKKDSIDTLNDNVFSSREKLFWAQSGVYHIELTGYQKRTQCQFEIHLYRGLDRYNCELLEAIPTVDYQFAIKVINTIAQDVDAVVIYRDIQGTQGNLDDLAGTMFFSTNLARLYMYDADKVRYLKSYLEVNKNAQSESWEYEHTPFIIAHLNTFNRMDYEELEQEIENWDDLMIYNLANALLECGNYLIDGDYLYCKIFLQIDISYPDLDILEQEILGSAFGIRNQQPIAFYDQLIEKVKELNRRWKKNCDYTVNSLEELKRKL